jgi:hypothetical protein
VGIAVGDFAAGILGWGISLEDILWAPGKAPRNCLVLRSRDSRERPKF